MKIQRLPLICTVKTCGHEFIGEIVVQCPIDTACAVLKALRCPECGSKNVNIRLKPARKRRERVR